MTCRVKKCEQAVLAKSLCHRHYQQVYLYGRVLRTKYDPNSVRRRNGYAEIGLRDRTGNIKKWTKIDLEDVERVLTKRWSLVTDRGYVGAGIGSQAAGVRRTYLHRFVTSARPGQIVDHINGDRLDNRKSNLRFVTIRQNNRNSTKSRGGYRRRGIAPAPNGYAVQISVCVKTYKEALRIREAWEEVVGWSE